MDKSVHKLLRDGSKALAQIEQSGMRIDVSRLDNTIKEVGQRIKRGEERLRQDEVWGLWKRRFGEQASLGSRHQLGQVLRKQMDVNVQGLTRTGRMKTNEEALSKIDLPFVRNYLRVEKLKKLHSTYLRGVRREVVDDYLHPSFNLHLARTFRSSSDRPNFQNIPVRDKMIGKLIRSCFVPRDGHVLVELDYKSIEVCVAACYNKDPQLIEYVEDPSSDMHRDMAMEIYLLDVDQVTKETRFYAKNGFVFPEFYGSFYVQCAPNLWDAIGQAGLKTVDGVPLNEHLEEQGIVELGACDRKQSPEVGTFESHVQEVETDFWGRRFRVYTQWKKRWFDRYQREGGFDLLTGFRINGVYKRNDVINYPIQGSAFHCLLWSLIRLQRWLVKRKTRSVIVGQIHDSIVADVHKSELGDFLVEAKRIMTEDIRTVWPWIIVPLTVEAEVSETNWWEKKEVEIS